MFFMSELKCEYTLREGGSSEVLKFKKSLLDTFFIIVNNRPFNEWEKFGDLFNRMMAELSFRGYKDEYAQSKLESLSGSSVK